MTRTPLSRSKSQSSRSPGRFTHRGLNASGSCSGERMGTYWASETTATLQCARWRWALRRPQKEERGGGISWRPPAYSLFFFTVLQFYCHFILFYFSCCRPTLPVSLYLINVNVYVRFSHIIMITYLFTYALSTMHDPSPDSRPT